ncbi:hypothetical protein CEXT_152881 [Caerostris extrusa]|uniref:Uncharacterized protein n=1 Tax=Caerostris extrusa TaxID=172846 RepID=A0AAV4U0J5_CAEEX|nr:hypothetical protein CEXT_152881 [Caerostris extrusa]
MFGRRLGAPEGGFKLNFELSRRRRRKEQECYALGTKQTQYAFLKEDVGTSSPFVRERILNIEMGFRREEFDISMESVRLA